VFWVYGIGASLMRGVRRHRKERRFMRLATLSVCSLMFMIPASAADLSTPADTRALAEAAMKLIVVDKINEAFDLLKAQWPVPSNEIDTLVLKTIQQRNLAQPRFGKTLGYAFIKEEKVTDFALRYTFAEKRELHALRWQFTFYKPAVVWKVNSVTWDDNMGALFTQ
jgi:hypothetical protein